MSNFKAFKTAMQKHVATLFTNNNVLYHTSVGGDELVQWFLDALPAHLRAEYTCNACRSFIKHFGGLVAIDKHNNTHSIWNFEAQDEFIQVNEVLANIVLAATVREVFVPSKEQSSVSGSQIRIGLDSNVAQIHDENNRPTGETVRWEHLCLELPNTYFFRRTDTAEAERGKYRDHKTVLATSLDKISLDAVQTVDDLISSNSLYRGEENSHAVKSFLKLKEEYDQIQGYKQQSNFCWRMAVSNLHESILRFKNTSIGTLALDIAEGKGLDEAVKLFESKVAPANYKRPKPVVTPRMIADAEKTVNELGLGSALFRRMAVPEDLSVANALYVNRSLAKNGRLASTSAFAALADVTAAINPKQFSKVELVTLKDFVANVLPTSKTIELLLENRHEASMVSLIAPVNADANPLFKWNNPFSWSYNKAMADTMREKVVARGGSVNGVLRFTHQWNDIGRNSSLMDLHVFLPGSSAHKDGISDSYPNGPRVGWNNRQDRASHGVQDVDYVDAAPEGYVPVENITFPSMQYLKDGKYIFKIHNWALRHPTTSGFKAEIEFGGQVYSYDHPKPLAGKEWVTVAEATLKNGEFTIDHKLTSSSTQKEFWGLKSYSFVPVSAVTYSPNYWGEDWSGTGNRHVFFFLQGAKNQSIVRGFFNEMLDKRLDKHSRAFETLAGKLTVEPAEEELSGVGFATTGDHEFVVKVKGNSGLERIIRVVA